VATTESVRALLEPPLAAEGFEVVDVHVGPGLVRVLVDHPDGMSMDAVTKATHLVIAVLDADDPVPGHYNLEVSSPGIERPLRTPAHFQRCVGELVNIKTHAHVEGERRVQGTLEAADDEGITVAGRHLAYADIDRARRAVEWTKPKPITKKKKAVSS
jgi:ribosome maturation factor RimP